jgi:antitoxin MazE
MKTKIQKLENSLAILIPEIVANEIKVGIDTDVDLSVEDGKIIITPIYKLEYDLNDILAKINETNIHNEIDFGNCVSNEVW